MNFIEHIAKGDREIVYIQALEWILLLPNSILDIPDKNKFLAKLFKKRTNTSDYIKVDFNIEAAHLHIEDSKEQYYILGLKNYISHHSNYKDSINRGGKVGVIYDYDSPDTFEISGSKIISHKIIIDSLDELQIKDYKTQYLIDDLIEGLKNWKNAYIF